MRRNVLLLLGLVASLAHAQPSSVGGPVNTADTRADDIPLTDYLGLLEQISPAASRGAQAYLDAFRRRCGRTLTAAELRRAVVEQDGDPVLMQMIRASYLQDRDALSRLAAQVPCRLEARR